MDIANGTRVPLMPMPIRWPMRLLAAVYILEIPVMLVCRQMIFFGYKLYVTAENDYSLGIAEILVLGIQLAMLVAIAVCVAFCERNRINTLKTRVWRTVLFTIYGYLLYAIIFFLGIVLDTWVIELWLK